MQGIKSYFKVGLILFIPLRGAGVDIPAEVVEARLLGELADFIVRALFEMHEANHHIGDLHAGVINIVLHRDLGAAGPQQTDEGVSQDGVAQMADVRRLVGIDAGVLHQNFFRRRF